MSAQELLMASRDSTRVFHRLGSLRSLRARCGVVLRRTRNAPRPEAAVPPELRCWKCDAMAERAAS